MYAYVFSKPHMVTHAAEFIEFQSVMRLQF
jgi:hypothetical protein